MANISIIQWNAQSLSNKKDEILDLISRFKPYVIAVQETKMRHMNFRIPCYNVIHKPGHFNRTQHGGVAIFIHTSVPFQELHIASNLQAIAARIGAPLDITICNLYIPGSQALSEANLTQVLAQLPPPYVVLGDFNAHNPMWGSGRFDTRGRMIEHFIVENGLCLLNTGEPTRISSHSSTAIDLSLCSAGLSMDLAWNVLESPLDSDHCPIVISVYPNAASKQVTLHRTHRIFIGGDKTPRLSRPT